MFSALTLMIIAGTPVPSSAAPSVALGQSAAPDNVYVGMYLTDVSDFDLKAGRFMADLHVWVKWLGGDQVPNVTFENGEIDKQEVLGTEHEGAWHSVQWRLQGTFRGEFPVHAFPFDRQTLPIIFGLNQSEGRLVPDLGASGMSPSFSVSGWSYEPQFAARSEQRLYASDLGSIAREGKNTQQGLSIFSVEMKRPFGPYLIKFALPLALILLVALLALLLPPERLDVRSAMGITALLSCIAFHYTQADTLPNVTYLVAADKLFLGAYVFVATTLLVSIISFRLSDTAKERALTADRYGLWSLPSVSVVSLIGLVSGSLWRAEPVEPFAPQNPFSSPRLRVAVTSLENPGQLPLRRSWLVVKGSDGVNRPLLAQEAPAMTNSLVRLLPDGGMRVRWKLRADARWSDGYKMTADDLIFSLETSIERLRTRIERIDERTVDVTYSERHAEFLNGFTVFPRSAAAFAADGGRDAMNQANSEGLLSTGGPFVVGEFEKGKKLTLLRNDRYAAMRPAFEKVEAKVMNPLDAARALLADELDVIPTLTPDSYELLRNEKSVRVLEQPGDLLWVLVPKLSEPPWDSLEARSALLSAIDRKAMVSALAPAPSRVASGWRAGPELPLPKAGALPLPVTSVKLSISKIRAKGETHEVLAQHIVDDLAKAGITVEVVQVDQLFQLVSRGEFEGLALVSRDTTSPSRFMNVTAPNGRPDLSKPAGPHFDAEMVEKWDRFDTSLYAERRGALESALERAWFARLPMLPLVLTSRLAAVRAELVGPDWGQADSLWWNVAEWHRESAQTARP